MVFIGGDGECTILLFCTVFCDYGGVYCYEIVFMSCSLILGVCLCIVTLCSGCDGCCAFSLICDACCLRCAWSGIIGFVVCLWTMHEVTTCPRSKKTQFARGWTAADICTKCVYTIPAPRDGGPIPFF